MTERWRGWSAARVLLVIGTATVLNGHAAAAQAAGPALAFTGVTVVDVATGRLRPAQTVLVRGSRIRAVGPSRGIAIPPGAQVVDARGRYLIPGLWDMHVHVFAENLAVPYGAYVAAGITGLREMSTGHLDSVLKWQREIRDGTRVGPRVLTSGPKVAYKEGGPGDGGGHSFGVAIGTPAEARHVVDSLKAAGVNLIKVYDTYSSAVDSAGSLPPAVYFALAAEARRVGLPFAGHPPSYVTLADASDSGQRSFEHWPVMRNGPYRSDPCLSAVTSPASADECTALAARLRRNGSWFTPTLMFGWDRNKPKPHPGLWFVQRLRRFGFPILAGSDQPILNPRPDRNPSENAKVLRTATVALHGELALFVQAGLTPLEALQTATLNPARYFGATDSLGTIAPGKLADLVLLDANPLADIVNTTTIRAVVANGRYFDRAALDHLLPDEWTGP